MEIPSLDRLPWPISWLVKTSLEFLAISFFIFLGSILFPWVLSLVIAFFLDEIVTVVRESNYNNKFSETLGNSQAIIYAVIWCFNFAN